MSEKIESAQETFRKRIYEYYSDHESKGKKFTVDHFETEHVPKSTTALSYALRTILATKEPLEVGAYLK